MSQLTEDNSITAELTPIEELVLGSWRRIPVLGKSVSSTQLLKAFRGSAWTTVGYGSSQVIRLASMLILARHLLSPGAFGLFALVNVFLSGLALLSDLGIKTDVIQHRRGDEPEFINTAFLIQVVRGVILWLLASLFAYPFARFYHQTEVLPLALVSALSVLAINLTSGSVFTLTRHVRLRGLTLLRIAAETTGLLVSVSWAMVSPTAWALVVGRVITEAFYTIGTHFLGNERITLHWDKPAARDIMVFGAGVLASSSTYFLAGEAERLVVAKFIDLAMLGCFALALSITSVPTGAVERLGSQVFYPMIASAVRGGSDPARQFRNVRFMLAGCSAFIGITFIVGGKWIVAVLLGPKFVQAGWILQLLGFRAAIDVFTPITAQMLFALGMTKYSAFGNLAKLLFIGTGLTIAFMRFGFREAVWVLALSSVVAHIPLLLGLRRHLRKAFAAEALGFTVVLLVLGMTAALQVSVR